MDRTDRINCRSEIYEDTISEKATEVCDVINAFGYAVQTIFLSPGGWLFLRNNNLEELTIADQKQTRDYIGKNYPDRYKEIFGEVEEA